MLDPVRPVVVCWNCGAAPRAPVDPQEEPGTPAAGEAPPHASAPPATPATTTVHVRVEHGLELLGPLGLVELCWNRSPEKFIRALWIFLDDRTRSAYQRKHSSAHYLEQIARAVRVMLDQVEQRAPL